MSHLRLALVCGAAGVAGLWLPGYQRFLYYEILAWSLLALSVDVLYGQAGLLSFGQGVYFALASYIFLHAATSDAIGVLGAGVLAVCGGLALAAFTGLFLVRMRGHFFVLSTVILSLCLFLIGSSLTAWTGGDDGLPLQSISHNLVGGIEAPAVVANDPNTPLACVGILAAMLYWAAWTLRSSLFGLALAATKFSDMRMAALQFPVRRFQYAALCIAGAISAVAGVLVVTMIRYSTSMFFHWTTSGEGVIWAVLGGVNTVWGAWLGTALLIYVKDLLSSVFAYYPIIIGIMLIGLVHLRSEGLLRLSFRGSPSAKRFRYAHFPERPSDLAAAEAPSNTPPAEVVLRDARKRFDTATVLDGCTLRLSPQEFEFLLTDGSTATVRAGEDRFPALALIGPNGAGKTTLLNVLCGYVPLDSGGLTAGGAPVTAPVPNPVLGRSFQQPQLFDGLTVGEHLLVGAMRGMRGRKNLRSAARVPELRQQAMSVAERLELTPDLNRLVSELSYGRRKFVDIAVTIASRPGMLILDEPTAGVSPREITLLVDAICDLARSMPILMVEHNLDVVRRLDFTAVFMADGALIAHGELADVLSRQDVRQLFTGHRIGQVES